MRSENPFREALEAGDPVLGARATVVSPALVEVYGAVGLDFVWVDFEHGGPSAVDAPAVESLTRAADAADVDLLCRVPGDPDAVRKTLDAGARNLFVPRVESAAEVREAVAATRFVYDGAPGARGAASGRANVWGRDRQGYVAREDGTVCLGVMIENERALDALEEILAVPELGFVFVGPGDLSVSMGYPLKTSHPEVQEAVEEVRRAASAAGVPAGRILDDAALAREAIDEGFQILRVGDEVSAAAEVLGQRVREIRR